MFNKQLTDEQARAIMYYLKGSKFRDWFNEKFAAFDETLGNPSKSIRMTEIIKDIKDFFPGM